jgi:hypothetical protein
MFLNRRELLRQTAGLAAAVLGLAAAAPRFVADAVADASGLTLKRRSTFAALVEAVSRAGDNLVDASDPGAAVDRFDAWYDAQPGSTRTYADTVLDAIETMPPDGTLSELDPSSALSLLRNWTHSGFPFTGTPKVDPSLVGDDFVKTRLAALESTIRPTSPGPLNPESGVGAATVSAAQHAALRAGFFTPRPPSREQTIAAQAILLAAIPFYADPFDPHPIEVTV